jgi:hypothetical protein
MELVDDYCNIVVKDVWLKSNAILLDIKINTWFFDISIFVYILFIE